MPLRRHLVQLAVAAAMIVSLEACIGEAQPATHRRHPASNGPIVPAPPPERSISLDELLELRYALLRDDFALVDERLAWRLDSARSDAGYEVRYRVAFSVLMSADSTLRPHLDEWIAREPQSGVAHLARAAHAIGMAEGARGFKYMDSTSSERITGMVDWYRVAQPDLVRGHDLDSTNVMAHWLALTVAMQVASQDERRALLDAGLRQLPGSLMLRWRYGFALRPRWGGSVEELEDFAGESDSAAVTNPRLRLLRGLVAYDSGVVFAEAKDFQNAIRMHTQALSHGDFWIYRVDRGDAYMGAERYDEAIADFDSALAQMPALTSARMDRASVLYYLASRRTGAERDELMRRARLDVCIAAEFDASDNNLWLIKAHPELRPYSKGGAPPLSPIGVPPHPLLMGRC